MIGNRLVIACDQSYGKVGDVIDFVQKDGTVISCVIGALTYSAELKNKVSFFVNKENWTSESPLDSTKNLAENTTKAVNKGNIDTVLKTERSSQTNTNQNASDGTSQNQNTNSGTSNESTNSNSGNVQGQTQDSSNGTSDSMNEAVKTSIDETNSNGTLTTTEGKITTDTTTQEESFVMQDDTGTSYVVKTVLTDDGNYVVTDVQKQETGVEV